MIIETYGKWKVIQGKIKIEISHAFDVHWLYKNQEVHHR